MGIGGRWCGKFLAEKYTQLVKHFRHHRSLFHFGGRVQYSVFEAILTKELLEKMVFRLKRAALEQEDSIRIYRLCGECEKVIDILGLGKVSKDKDVYIL